MRSLLIAVFLICAALLFAAPDWFNNDFSNQLYLIGNGSARIEDKDKAPARQTAWNDALAQISQQIYSEVEAYTKNSEVEGFENRQFYAKDVQIKSCLSLCGAEELKKDASKGFYYIQLGIRRDTLRRHYFTLVQTSVENAIALNAAIEQTLEQDPKAALQMTRDLRALLEDLARDTMILGSLQNSDLAADIPALRQIPRIPEVDSRLVLLGGNLAMSFADLAQEAVGQLRSEFRKPLSYNFSYIEWANTGFSSEFSASFSDYLGSYLEGTLGWVKSTRSQTPKAFFSGQLIEEGNRYNLVLRFSGPAAQTLVIDISPSTIIRYGADKFKPENLERELAKRKELLEDSIISNKLRVEVKFLEYGTDPAVFYIGDEANIYVRANKPCYLSVVNLEADGERNVLVQNMRISPDLCNEWLTLSDSFEVTEPTGIEQLFVQADVKRLEEWETVEITSANGGTKNIATGHKAALAKTRGLERKAAQSEYTEAYLTWTVLE